MRLQTFSLWCIAGILLAPLLLSPLCSGQTPTSPPTGNKIASSRPQSGFPPGISTILERAETFTLYSLEPSFFAEAIAVEKKAKNTEKKKVERFHDWHVLGKSRIKSVAKRKKLITALRKGIAESDGSRAKCFEPRHAIRATYKGQTADLLICFACLYIEIYHNNVLLDYAPPISGSPAAPFNQALKDAKLPLAHDERESSAPKH